MIAAGKFRVNSMHDITEKICSKYSIDPLGLISSGSMLITTSNGEELVKILKKEGIKASIIGKIIKGDSVLVDKRGKEEAVFSPERDELFVLEEKIN